MIKHCFYITDVSTKLQNWIEKTTIRIVSKPKHIYHESENEGKVWEDQPRVVHKTIQIRNCSRSIQIQLWKLHSCALFSPGNR